MKTYKIEKLLLNLLVAFLRNYNVQKIDVGISGVQGRHITFLVNMF